MPTFTYDNLINKTLSPATLKALSNQIRIDVNQYCVKEFTDDYRHHLGMSVIGDKCYRRIWYGWRWVKFGVFDGRMLRLFNRGHLEEQRFDKWLRGIGATLYDVDPSTGQQFKISYINGHYGGTNDRVVILPYLPDLPLLTEYKTHNEKSFTNLMNKGLIISKPKHYSQMCNYGEHYKLKYGLYCATDKNDDDLYFEVVELDWKQADQSLVKAEEIIYAQEPPPKISHNPAYYECKMCSVSDICHDGASVEKNCRSCKCAEPIENAEWKCTRFNQTIPKNFLPIGCEYHVPITQ